MAASPQGGDQGVAAMLRRLSAYAVLAVVVGLLAWLSLAILGPSWIAPIWPANGVLLAVLLRNSPRLWPAALLAGVIGIGAGGMANGGAATSSFGLGLCDLVEVTLSALAIRTFGGGQPDLSRMRFVAVAGFAALGSAAVGAVGAGLVLDWLGRGHIAASAVVWTLANALGQMTAAPIVLASRTLEEGMEFPSQNLIWGGAGLATLTAVVVATFQQSRYDMLYLVLGPLLVVVFQLEVLGAAIGILLTSVVAVAFTVQGHGPMWLLGSTPIERVILLQLFLLGVVAMNFPLAAALADRRRTQAGARRSQARLQFLSDNSRDLVFEFDEKARITYASAAARHFGYEPEEMVGEVSFKFLHPDDVARAKRAMAIEIDPSLAEGEMSYEWRLRTKAGDYVWVEGNPAVSRNALGKPVGYTDSVRDISRRKLLEEEVRRTQAETEAAEAGRRVAETRARENQDELARVARVLSVGEFASTIAHELNQPIAAIVTNGDTALRWLAAEPPVLDEARAAVARSIRDANRAAAVVSRTRAMLAKGSPAFAEVDLNACINDVLLFTDTALRRNRITVSRRLAVALPPVWGDRVQLQQVLLNLIGNSMDAMAANEGRPRMLGIVTTVDDAGGVVVAVEDTGAGLDPAVAERLFDSFFTTKADGVGLGLPISRSIVETHGGRLSAAPRPGGGAVFRFTLRPAAARAA
jgi:PAS domain S-box-containing protein